LIDGSAVNQLQTAGSTDFFNTIGRKRTLSTFLGKALHLKHLVDIDVADVLSETGPQWNPFKPESGEYTIM